MDRTRKLLFLPVFAFLLCFFLFVARHRFIDPDEGYYLMASRLVLQHKLPYLDFFYQQAPLLPYAYGLWMKLFGISWFSARSFSATLSAILGLLIYDHVCHQTRRWLAGLAAVVLYVSSSFVFAWFPLVKTYSLATLFLFGAYVVVTRLLPASSPWLAAVSGVLFGLSVDTRSYIVVCAPLFLWWVFRHSETGDGIARILWFLGGFTIGIGPSLCFFVASPDRFLFNNFGYHVIRTEAGLIGAWSQKLLAARILLFSANYNGIQFCLLAAVCLASIFALPIRRGAAALAFLMASAVSFASIFVLRIRRDAALLAFLIAVVLAFISILPTPLLVQYFCICMPFLIVAAVCAASDYITSLPAAGTTQRVAVLAGIALLATFVASSVPNFRSYLITGEHVIGMLGTDDAPNWTLDEVSAVSKAIDQLAAPKERIASFWPGYIFASQADPYPGFENDFGRMISRKLTVDQRTKYHIIAESDIEADFAAHTPRIAVLGNRIMFGPQRIRDVCDNPYDISACATMLLSHGYSVVRTIGDTSIFVSSSRP